MIDVADAAELLEIAIFPCGRKVDGTYYQYEFHIPGVKFTLYLGKRMPDDYRKLCAVRSSENWIFLSRETGSVSMALNMLADRARARM